MSDILTSARGQRMFTYVPPYYASSRVMQSIFQADGSQFDALRDALNQILDQWYAETATWALDKWETELGLTVAPDQPVDQRRARIISKLRGYGTATIALIKNIAEAYENGSVNVIEDFANYTVIIMFVDQRGIPPNLSDLQSVLRAVIPAHLQIQYQYRYFRWDELDNQNWTWNDLDGKALTWGQIATYSP